jgi:2,3-dihydroxybiphenyl 1,2-dioxygenase
MQLGFLEFEVREPAAWERFLTEVLGLLHVGEGRFAMDGHAWRFQLAEGPADDLACVGWELTETELAERLAGLAAAGHETRELDPSQRGAAQRHGLDDPSGVPTELVCGLDRAETPFASALVSTGFVADAEGLGHVVLTTSDKAASLRFYQDLLGFRLSDQIICELYGFDVDLSFFHVNPRHHSLAFGGALAKRLHHFMVEAADVDQVGLCYDRAIRSGVTITQTLGRHPNDRMLSFYALTPSGFQFEFGWGGRKVDDATWQPTTYSQVSEWGHHPPQVVFRKKDRP